MTEMNKQGIRKHWKRYSVAYTIVLFLLGCMVAIGLEARGFI
jgi:hypothetical protein